MLRARRIPVPAVKSFSVSLGHGLDTESSPMESEPGSARASINYEVAFGGGFERVQGFERFDGRDRPSDATYSTLVPVAALTGVVAGDALTGASSGASGTVIYVGPDLQGTAFLALTAISGSFAISEQILKSGSPVGQNTPASPAISAALGNQLSAMAAEHYRPVIGKPPGSGPVRGIAALGANVFAWRDTADGSTMEIHKATAAGWVVVPRHYEYRFTLGTSQYVDGETITQGGVSATIKRVVLESGSWGSTAAGRLIVTQPTGGSGNFSNGATAGDGACTLGSVPASAALAQVTLLPGGRVEITAHNFYGSTDSRRLYGCDGVNREFEFDGEVLVPLAIGMNLRARFVSSHRNYLWFAFNGSLQKSVIGNPYQWSVVLGAGEIGIGDEITGLASVPGNQDTSSLAVTSKNSMNVLYGSTSSAFTMDKLSGDAGASAYSLQLLNFPIGHDPQGFRLLKTTQTFGNFSWDIASRTIDRLARDKTPVCSVFTSRLSRYRCFFSDGSVISGTPTKKGMAWSQLNYGVDIVTACSAEVGGQVRTFYGASDGWVFEADVGRSFDGQPIAAALRLGTLDHGTPMMEKRFRDMEIEAKGDGAFTLYASAEFDDGDPNNDLISPRVMEMAGQGAQWDVGRWDESRWNAASVQRKVIEVPGIGYGIAPIFYCSSAIEKSHTIRSATPLYSLTKTRKS